MAGISGMYLQLSVCLLPERAETARHVNRLLDRVRREGGEGRVLPITIDDPAEERALIEEFRRERADEYAEVASRTPAFLKEIEMERAQRQDDLRRGRGV